VFISSPCKGASGLLSEALSLTPKYQALNELTLRCVWLMCEAWQHNPVSLIVFENVPRLASRGRHLLDQIGQILEFFGYAVAETTHDCGELGGLAQSRKRFLLVARHIEKVPPFLYEPEKKSLQSVGAVLGRMPMPGDIERAGPMHRVPSLQWKTWVRLALVEAGA
jgi:site-specific DNA-cytosine methylase